MELRRSRSRTMGYGMSAVSAERVDFFYRVRGSLFGGRISSSQFLGMRAKLDEFKKRALTDLRWLAYILATSYHETGKHMMPVREGFASNDADARRIVAGREYGKPDPWTGQVYYGRGDVQLTWRKNYDLMGHLLNLPLVANPDLALKPDVSSAIMFEGMIQGLFTDEGYKLSEFFHDDTPTGFTRDRSSIASTVPRWSQAMPRRSTPL